MPTEKDLYYLCRPMEPRTPALPIAFLTVSEFLQDEPACKLLWELVSTQFRTRSKFLAIWSGVQFVASHRDSKGSVDGFLLINTPVNWQIDYVVVRPDARGQGIAAALVMEALNQAFLRHVPYVMLTSKPSLRGLYESCGFTVVGSSEVSKPSSSSPLAGRAGVVFNTNTTLPESTGIELLDKEPPFIPPHAGGKKNSPSPLAGRAGVGSNTNSPPPHPQDEGSGG